MRPINEPPAHRGTLWCMGTLAILGLMLLTLAASYALWSLLLRAERLYTHCEGHGGTAADIAGIAFFGLAAIIVLGASAALVSEARHLLSALLV